MKKLLIALLAGISLAGIVSTPSHAQEERWLKIHNDTDTALCEVYITHVGDEYYGDDLIGSCIQPGRYRTVDPGWQQGYCKMDLMFVFDGAADDFIDDYNICEETDLYINGGG